MRRRISQHRRLVLVIALAAIGCGNQAAEPRRSFAVPVESASLADLELLVRADERLRVLSNLMSSSAAEEFSDAEIKEAIVLVVRNEANWLATEYDHAAGRRYPMLAAYESDLRALAEGILRDGQIDEATLGRIVELRAALRAAAGLPPP
jgi:hypothetical protein